MVDTALGFLYNAVCPLVKTASFPRPGVRFGTLGRMRRTDGAQGDAPPRPQSMPINAIRVGLVAAGAMALLRRLRRR